MEQIIEVGSYRFMLGLQWMQLQGKDPLLAAKTRAQSGRTPYGIIRAIDRGDGSTSFQVAMTAMKHKGPVYVASAHLVSMHPSVIAIEKLESDLYWLCVSDGGRVLPGYDTVSSDSEVKMLLAELSTEYELDYMTMIMDLDVSTTFGIPNAIGKSPFEFIASKNPVEATKIRNLAGVPSSVYLGGMIGLIVALMGGGWAYQKHQKKLELERLIAMEQAEQEERERLAQGQKEVTEADILANAREEEILWLRDDFNKKRLLPSMKQILILSDSLPPYFMGWRLKSISFSSDKADEMVSLWVSEGGITASLNKLFQESNETVAYSTDLKTARVGHKVSLGSEGIRDLVEHINTKGINHQVFADILSSAGYPMEIQVNVDNTRAKPIEGIKDPHLRNSVQFVTRQRTFTTQVDSREGFQMLMHRLQKAGNFLPSKISVDREGNTTKWTLVGILYEI